MCVILFSLISKTQKALWWGHGSEELDAEMNRKPKRCPRFCVERVVVSTTCVYPSDIPNMGVSENSVPLNPMVLLIIIPIKWLFHWEYTLFSDKPISLWYHHFFQEKNRPGRLEVWIPLRPLRRAQGRTSVARRSPREGGGSGGSEAASDKGGLVYAEPAKIRSLNYTCMYLDENIGKGLWIDSLVNRLWTDDFWTVSGGNWYPTKTQDSYVLTDAND